MLNIGSEGACMGWGKRRGVVAQSVEKIGPDQKDYKVAAVGGQGEECPPAKKATRGKQRDATWCSPENKVLKKRPAFREG